MPVLKLSKHDPKKELEFDVECQLKISPAKRLENWLAWNLSMLKFVRQQQTENRKSNKVIKRL